MNSRSILNNRKLHPSVEFAGFFGILARNRFFPAIALAGNAPGADAFGNQVLLHFLYPILR